MIYRYDVPVDDRWHDFDLTGPIVHVATRHPDRVEFWAIHDPGAAIEVTKLKVFGTGHPMDCPDGGQVAHIGTALVPPSGGLVWHLMLHIPAIYADPSRSRVRRLW